MQLSLTAINRMELLAIGRRFCLKSQMEQHLSTHNFKHLIPERWLHLQFFAKILKIMILT